MHQKKKKKLNKTNQQQQQQQQQNRNWNQNRNSQHTINRTSNIISSNKSLKLFIQTKTRNHTNA